MAGKQLKCVLLLFCTVFTFVFVNNYFNSKVINKRFEKYDYNYLTKMIATKLATSKTVDDAFAALLQVTNKNYQEIIKPWLHHKQLAHLVSFRNSQERKYAFVEQNSTDACTVVTLGIGGDISAEQAFKKHTSNCKFYGVDPTFEDGHMYRKIGNYYQLAISATTGNHTLSIHKGYLKGYHFLNLKSTSLEDFLVGYVGQRNIDHMWMDIEGQEYDLLAAILKNDKSDNAKYAICQMNIELHRPLSTYYPNTTYIHQLMLQFVTESNYIPIHAKICGRGCPHLRLFLINVKSDYCLKKIASKFNNYM